LSVASATSRQRLLHAGNLSLPKEALADIARPVAGGAPLDEIYIIVES